MAISNKEIIRMAINSGNLSWADAVSISRSMTAPEDYSRYRTSGSGNPAASDVSSIYKRANEAKGISSEIVDDKPYIAEPEEARQSAVDASGVLIPNPNTGSVSVDSTKQHKMPVANKKSDADSDGLKGDVPDALRSIYHGFLGNKIENQYGRRSFTIAPAVSTADGLKSALNDPDFYKLAKLTIDKQGDVFYSRESDPMSSLTEQQRNEYNRLKAEEEAAYLEKIGAPIKPKTSSASIYPARDYDSIKGQSERYIKSLNTAGSFSDKQIRDSYKDKLYKERLWKNPYMQVGMAMKKPLTYLSDPETLVGDFVSTVAPKQTAIRGSREYEKEWVDRAYNEASPLSTEFLNDAASKTSSAMANMLPFAIGGTTAMSMASGLGAGLVAGLAAINTSEAVVSPSKYRTLGEGEIPDDLMGAYGRYSGILEYLGRGEKYNKHMPSIEDIADGKNINIDRPDWYDNLMDEVESDYADSEEKIKWAENAKRYVDNPSLEFQQTDWYNTFTSVGASASELGAMAANVGVSTLAFSIANRMMKSPFGAKLPNLYVPATAISTAAGAYTSVLSRRTELYSQYNDANNQKFDQIVQGLDSLSGEELVSLIDPSVDSVASGLYVDAISELKSGGLSERTRMSVLNGIKNGLLKTNNEDIELARQHALSQSRELAMEFMALGLPDMFDGVVAALPFNAKKIASIARAEGGLAGNLVNAVDDLTAYAMKNKAIKSAGKFMTQTKAGKFLSIPAKYIAGNALNMPQELFLEELPQEIITTDYLNERLTENRNLVGSVLDAYSRSLTGTKALFGMSGDPLYDDNNDLVEIAKQTAFISMILPGIITTATGRGIIDAVNLKNEIKAMEFVKANVLSTLGDNNRMSKSDVYVNSMSSSGKEFMLDYLETIKQNLPDGVTADEIDNEIKTARETFSIADSAPIKRYAKQTGGIGSQDHKQLVGLIMTHRERANNARGEAMDSSAAAQSELRSEYGGALEPSASIEAYLSDFNTNREQPITRQQMMALHASKVALEALDVVSFSDSYNSKFSKSKVSTMNSIKSGMVLAEKARFLTELNSLGLLSNEKYESLLLSKNSISEIISDALSESGLMIESSPGLAHTAKATSILIGSKYDDRMANKLMGYSGKKKMTPEEHMRFVDSHLEAYRSREESERKHQEILEEIDAIKAEAAGEKVNVVSTPKSVPFDEPATPVTPVEPVTTIEPIGEESPGGDIDTGADLADSASEDQVDAPITDVGETDQSNELDFGTDELTAEEEQAIANAAALASSIGAAAEDINEESQSEQDVQDESTPAIEPQTTDEQTDEDRAVYNSMEEQDSSAFYEAIDEHPDAIMLDPGAKFDKLSHTLLFGPDADRKSLSEFLMDPDAFNGDYSIRIEVAQIPQKAWEKARPGEKYIPFSTRDESTYDNALIVINIKKGGKTYKFMLSLPDAAIKSKKPIKDPANPGSTIWVDKFSASEIQALRDFRRRVISEYDSMLQAGGGKALKVIGGISRGKSKISVNKDKNGKSIQRPLHEIKGLIDGFDGDFSSINSNSLVIGYGKGAKGINIVAGKDGRLGVTVEQNSGSAMILKTNPFSGAPELLKINKLRIGQNKDLSRLIYRLVVENRASSVDSVTINSKGEVIKTPPGEISNLGMSSGNLLSAIVRFGEGTIVEDSKRKEMSHLLPKQFYIKNGTTLVYGENELNISNPGQISDADRNKLIKYIEDNFTWSLDKNKLWDPNGNDIKVSTLFPSISKHFEESNDKIKIANGFEFSKEDMNLTWLGWLVKNGKLIADLKDGVFDAPYAFVNDIMAVDVSGAKINDNQYSAPSVEDKPAITEENVGKDTTGNGDSFPDIDYDWIPQATRLASNPSAEQIPADIEDEVEWLASRLNVKDKQDLEIVRGLIELADGNVAMGALREYAIILSDVAEEGTAYHEAFHKVSLLMLPRKTRMKIYNDVRESNKSLRSASNAAIEEYLAESFRSFMLTNRNGKNPSSVKIAFRKMGNALKMLTGFKYKDINRLYSDINAGLFRSSKKDKKSVEEFNERYSDWRSENKEREFDPQAPRKISSLGMAAIKDAAMFYDIVDGLTFFLTRLNSVNKMKSDGNTITVSTEIFISDEASIDNIDFSALRKFVSENAKKQDGISKAIWDDIDSNFDRIFVPEIKSKLAKIGVSEFNAMPDESDLDGIISRESMIYDRPSYAISKANNVAADVKFFISTIADSTLINKDGIQVAVPIRDNVTKMYRFVPFADSWNRIINDLHLEPTPSAMIGKINRLADVTSDGFYKMLRAKLAEVDDNFITKLWTTLYSHKHQFVSFGYDAMAEENGMPYSISIEDSYIERRTRTLPIEWSENLSSNGFLYSDTVNGLVFNKQNAEDIFNRYSELNTEASNFLSRKTTSMSIESANKMLDSFIALFNQIGISIDSSTMNHLIGSGSMGKESRVRAICRLISDSSRNTDPAFIFSNILKTLINNNGEVKNRYRKDASPRTIFVKEKSCETLAGAYAYVHPSPNEVMVLGADNNNYYAVSERSYLTNIVDKIKRDKEFLNLMLGVPYNKHSLILKQIESGNGESISLKTFIKFYSKDGSDSGKDYKSTSKIEDYIVKMAMSLSGTMAPSPTFADKGSYYFIDGLKLPRYHGGGSSVRYHFDGKNKYVNFPEDTLDIMDGYFTDEFEAIKAAWNDVLSANGDKRLLQSNYHFGGQNARTGKKNKFDHGNGLRFRNFDMLQVSKEEGGVLVNELVDLNQLIESLLSLHGEIDGMNMFIDFMEKNYFGKKRLERLYDMNNTLSVALRDEIQWAVDAGIISRDSNGRLENKFIDSAIFKSVISEFDAITNSSELANEAAVINLIANNMVNGIIGNVEFEKVVSKDSAFFKNPDDRIKRLSSIISTGKDLRTEFPAGHELHGKTSFNIAHVEDNIMSSPEIKAIKDRVLSATINSLIRQSTGEYVQGLSSIMFNPDRSDALSALKKRYSAQFEQGEKIASEIVKGYGEVDETDGTAWISPEMYRSILIRSKGWNSDMQKVFDMIEGEDQSWMADDQKYAMAMEFMMQPLKMIYFGDDIKRNLNTPRLNKMAMFAVFRPIATGDLKKMHERMTDKKNPLHMIAVSQASKVGLRNPQKLYTDESNTKLNDLYTLDVFQQKFEYLRHQLVTDPHEGDRTELRTQVQKVSMSNIVKDKIYRNITIGGRRGVTGRELISEWSNAINELSNRGKAKVENEFGMTFDTLTGTYNVNTKKMYAFLQREAINSGMPTSTIEMLGEFDEKNPKDIPLQAMLNDSWIESKILSFIMRKTIDIDTPGGMFIQMSTFGVKITDDSLVSEYTLNGGKKLNFLNNDGSMDAIISINLFNDILPKNIRKNFKKSRQWLIDNNIIGENAKPSTLGYRIPTQGLSSVSVIRIKDVMVDTVGDTIILPSEFTKLTGSDFDIDKLFIARHNYDGTRKVEMDDRVDDKWANNSSAAIQNRLLDVMMAVVSDPDMAAEARMPIDLVTGDLKGNVLADIDSITKEDKKQYPFRYSRPSFNTDKKYEFTVSKNGIGPIALANANHPLTQMTGLSFIDADILTRFNMTRLDGVYGKDGIRILDWLSALINAHVDVAKDPYIIRLGINQHTYKAATFMLRTGAGRSTFYFLSQPIMRELYSIMDRYAGTYGVPDGDKSIDANAEALLKKYKEKALEFASKEQNFNKSNEMRQKILEIENTDDSGRKELVGNGNVFNKEHLRSILKKEDSFDWYYNQIMVLETFVAMAPFYNALSNLVKYSQVDTKKAGKSFAEQRQYGIALNEIIQKYNSNRSVFVGLDRYINDTFISTKMENSVDLAQRMFHGVLFRTTKSVQTTHDKIIALIGRTGWDNSELSKTIHRYIDSKIKSNFFVRYALNRFVNIQGLFFGENTMAKRLHMIKSEMHSGGAYERLIGNSFFENISYTISSASQRAIPDHVTVKANSSADQYYTDRIQQYFSDALSDSDPVISSFANDFMLYQFFSTGDNPAINTVKISEEDRRDIGFYEYIKNELDAASTAAGSYLSDEDIVDIFRNRWYDNILVPTKKTSREVYNSESGMFEQRQFPSLMSLPSQTIGGSRYPLVFVDMEPIRTFRSIDIELYQPFVKTNVRHSDRSGSTPVMYQLIGTTTIGNKVYPVYSAIEKLGTKSKGLSIIEHGFGRSFISTNNLPKVFESKTIDFEEWAKYPATKRMIEGPLKGFKEVDNMLTIYEDFSNDFADIDEIDYMINYRVSRAIESAIQSGDYSIGNVDNAIGDIPFISEQEIKYARGQYANGILSRSDELLANALMSGRAIDEDALESLEIRLKEYLGEYYQTPEDTDNNYTEDADTDRGNPSEYTNHSGGAVGADSMWDSIGREFGVVNHMHYYHGNKTPLGNQLISESDFNEGVDAMNRASSILNRRPAKQSTIDLLARNWSQVKYSTQINAIAPIANDFKSVAGGTGWAVAMAQSDSVKREINVFNLNDNKWYKWNGSIFELSDVPTLHKNFAGIGSRQDDGTMSQESIDAIRDVYSNTFKTTEPATINVYAGANENADLSNFAIRPFYDQEAETQFQSVEQAFHWYKVMSVGATDISNMIMKTTNGGELRKLTSKNNLQMSPDQASAWDLKSPSIMKSLIRMSFEQNKDAADRLIGTGSAIITHNQDNSRWKTEFPRILMDIRSELIDKSEKNQDGVRSSDVGAVVVRSFDYYGSTYFLTFFNGAVLDGYYIDGKGIRHELSEKNKRNLSSFYDNMMANGAKEILKADEDDTTSPLADDISDSDFDGVDASKLGISFELNEGQRESLNLITKFIDSGSLDGFVLKGSAGTGKTTIMKAVLGYISSINKSRSSFSKIKVALASPTNSQKRVLSDITGKQASTVHALLGMKPSANIDDFVLGQEEQFTNPYARQIPRNGLLIVDECSMLKDDLVDFILKEASSKNTMVLFLGDAKQLEPVNNIDKNTNQNKKSKALDLANSYELTEVMRVKGDNPLMTIVDYASKVMSPINSNIDVVRRTMHNGDSGAVFLSESAHEYLISESVNRYFNTDEFKKNPHYAKWITYTNRDVMAINAAIRSKLGYLNVVEAGEPLVGRKKVMTGRSETPIIENGDYYKVESVDTNERMITSSAVPGVDIPVIQMTISSAVDEGAEPVTLNVLNSNDMELISKIANAIASRESEISSSSASRQEKAEMWRNFRQALDNDFVTMFDIVDRYGPSKRTLKKAELWYYYAITTHTSQGKEFDNVFIHDTDLRLKMTDAPVETQGKIADEYKNLFYVAVSRAKKNAFVSTNGRRYNEVDGRWPMSRPGEFDTLPVSQTEEVFSKLKELGRQSDKC